MALWFGFYLLIGAIVGLFAGLLGVGGGSIQVPMMAYAFAHQSFGEQVLHMALGTSMATTIFTSIASLRAHHSHGAVDWRVWRGMTPGLVAGGFFGTWLAPHIPTFPLAVVFCAFVFYAATSMLINWKPKPSRQLPGTMGLFIVGFLICSFSSLVAVGGAAITIPILVFCNVPFHTAVGTAAAVGLPLALSATVGYVINGLGQAGLPAYSIGYVYLPALVGIMAASMVVAPIGARIAHKTEPAVLKKVFAVLMYSLAIKMLFDLR